MLTTKELKDIYLSISAENEGRALYYIAKHLNIQFCLLEQDGYSISIYFGKGNAAAYYENRKTGKTFMDFIGVTDSRLELLVFFARIMQLFGHDLSPFEAKMMKESEILFQEFGIE